MGLLTLTLLVPVLVIRTQTGASNVKKKVTGTNVNATDYRTSYGTGTYVNWDVNVTGIGNVKGLSMKPVRECCESKQ